MTRHSWYLSLPLLCAFSLIQAQSPPADPLVSRIQSELAAPFPPSDGKPDPKVPHGEFLHGNITDSTIFPGTENDFVVYVPAQYNPAKPACLLVRLDNFGPFEGTVLDNLIAKKEIPIMIGVGIVPGTIWKDAPGTKNRAAVRYNRSYEFDSMNDHLPDYVLDELLPAVQKMKTADGRNIRISSSGNDHAVTGGSTGGIGSFTLAWRRPDQFTRVYSVIGTFVSMRGGHEYPALIRKTEPRPLRIFLEDGSTDAWNPLFGSWYDANLNMESALRFSGYEVAHAWGTHGHNGQAGQVIFPDVLRWLWRNYPEEVKTGVSQNSTLQEIAAPGESWKLVHTFQSATGLAANAQGEVYVCDPLSVCVYRINPGGAPSVRRGPIAEITSLTFGPDGTLYGAVPREQKVIAIDPEGVSRTVAEGITARGVVVTHDGRIYVTEPGAHTDTPSRIWLLSAGRKKLLDQGLMAASGTAFSPDGSLFFAAEKSSKWIYSYVVQSDGSFRYKQPYFWLHMTDIPSNSGAEDMAVDTHGNLYVATRMGIQVCDQNGRVRAILPLPAPSGPVRGLAFGGEHFDILYASDGTQVFMRQMKVPGVAPWARRIAVPGHGPG